MRSVYFVMLMACVAGCATRQPVATVPVDPAKQRPVVRKSAATRLVETRYDVRAYRDGGDPAVRHEAHAVYRATRVPIHVGSLETAPRHTAPPVTYAPLPASAELSAELAAQQQISAELREIRARMAAIEQQAQSQYGTLINQTAETLKLREQLENERARVRELETELRDKAAASKGPEGMVAAKRATEMRW